MIMLSPGEIATMRTDHRGHFDHRCTIERFTVGAPDAYGQPEGAWNSYLADVPCSYYESAEVEVVGGVNVVITKSWLRLPANTDVSQGDRVSSVVGVDGTVIANALEILEVFNRIDGVDCLVEESE